MFPNLNAFDLIDGTLVYGNYGGLDYSAGEIGGSITQTPDDPEPVDAYDLFFYQHDLALQQADTPAERIEADIAVVEGVFGLLQDAVQTEFWFV